MINEENVSFLGLDLNKDMSLKITDREFTMEEIVSEISKTSSNSLNERIDQVLKKYIDELEKEIEVVKDRIDVLKGKPSGKKYNFIEKNITKKEEYQKDMYEERIHQTNFESRKILFDRRNELAALKLKYENIVRESSVSKKIEQIGIDNLQNFINIFKSHNVEYTLDELVSLFPTETSENLEFMNELVKKGSEYIVYDKTNNPILYRNLVERMKEQLVEDSSYAYNEKPNIDRDYDFVLNSIAEDGKIDDEEIEEYLPYVFEDIRFAVSKMLANSKCIPTNNDFQKGYEIFKSDAGKKIKHLYDNKDFVVGIHGTSFRDYNQIFTNGLRTFSDADSYNDLKRTVATKKSLVHLYTYNAGENSMKLGGCSYNYIFAIPKEAFDPESTVPLWGSIESQTRDCYLIPQYVYGMHDTKTNEFIRNEVKDKTMYKYFYKNGSMVPMNVESQELTDSETHSSTR